MIADTTFPRFVIEEQRRAAGAAADLSDLLHRVCTAVKAIAAAAARGACDRRHELQDLANALFLRACAWGGPLAAVASDELDDVHPVPPAHAPGEYLLAFDALDGASNVDVNAPAASIFSILRREAGPGAAVASDFLQPGARQVAAGYALYGPSAMLVVTAGRGVHGFTLDRELGEFVLTHREMTIPDGARELAIDASSERSWEPPVRRYVEECVAGRSGPREADFDMRWTASVAAEVHRILVRGGVFLCPRDVDDPLRPGRLRLLYEAAPLAFLMEQAGGAASTGRERLLDVVPRELHERVPAILGSGREVDLLVRYHEEHARGIDRPYASPLFGTRSLFVDP